MAMKPDENATKISTLVLMVLKSILEFNPDSLPQLV